MPELMHDSVLLHETVDGLNINGNRCDGTYIDGTFGRGGHSKLILSKLSSKGRLIAFDKDPEAILSAQKIQDPRFKIFHTSFADISQTLDSENIQQIDGLLLDLGISSPQVDDETRGFSFRNDGPLDMRMDPTKGVSAAQWLQQASQENIAEVIQEYGEERFALQIAKKIVASRIDAPIETTKALAKIVASAVLKTEKGKNPATRTFQAIRIYINRELEDLEIGLQKAWQRLALHGRMAIISFHSLEDRIVKRFFASHATVDLPDRHIPIRAQDLPQPELKLFGKSKPSKAEVERNVRARSAILRIAERIAFTKETQS